jgi:hypothetical protein
MWVLKSEIPSKRGRFSCGKQKGRRPRKPDLRALISWRFPSLEGSRLRPLHRQYAMGRLVKSPQHSRVNQGLLCGMGSRGGWFYWTIGQSLYSDQRIDSVAHNIKDTIQRRN